MARYVPFVLGVHVGSVLQEQLNYPHPVVSGSQVERSGLKERSQASVSEADLGLRPKSQQTHETANTLRFVLESRKAANGEESSLPQHRFISHDAKPLQPPNC